MPGFPPGLHPDTIVREDLRGEVHMGWFNNGEGQIFKKKKQKKA